MVVGGGMVNAANVGVTGNGAEAGDLKGGADFIPVFHRWAFRCGCAQLGMGWGDVQGGWIDNIRAESRILIDRNKI